MTAPTVYYYDDPGAPAWDSGVDGMYKVLKACLVDGYGNKAAAGWSTVFDTWSTDKSAQFTNASGSGLIGLKQSTSNESGVHTFSPVIYVADAMQSASIPVNGRSNGKQITDVSTINDYSSVMNSGYQRFSGHVNSFSQAWTLIANDNAAMLIYQSRSLQSMTVYGYQGNATFTSRSDEIEFMYFGAVSSGIGLGTMSSPQLGNFMCLFGTDSFRSNAKSFESSNTSMIVSVNRNASGLSSERAATIYPYYDRHYRPPRNLAVAELERADIFIGTNYNIDTQDLFGSVPLYCARNVCKFSDQTEVDKYSIAGANLKSPVTVNGVQYLYALVHNNSPIYISLDAADWS